MALINECCTKVEGYGEGTSVAGVKAHFKTVLTKGICSIDDEEEGCKSSSMPYGRFHVDLVGRINPIIVEACQDILSAEGLRSSNGGNNFLSNATAFCNLLQRQPKIEQFELCRKACRWENALHVC